MCSFMHMFFHSAGAGSCVYSSVLSKLNSKIFCAGLAGRHTYGPAQKFCIHYSLYSIVMSTLSGSLYACVWEILSEKSHSKIHTHIANIYNNMSCMSYCHTSAFYAT